MKYSKAVDFLIENGCPSIVFRTKKEILGKISKEEHEDYQKQLLQDDKVRYILSLQKEDGWLGNTFHGIDEPESGIRLLCEKGFDGDNPMINHALHAMEDRGDSFDEGCLARVGKILDERNLGGSLMMKACLYAYTGKEDTAFVTLQISKALEAFRFVTTIGRLEEIYEIEKGKYIFASGVVWPSIYHLRLLAFTHSWRNSENKALLVKAFQKLCELEKIPAIHLLHKSQLVAPGSFCMHDFAVNINELTAQEWMMWFHRMELIARLGIIREIPVLCQQILQLESMLDKNGGIFPLKLSHFYFHKWSAYTGLALENNWRKRNARECDLTFRSLLILKLSDGNSEIEERKK